MTSLLDFSTPENIVYLRDGKQESKLITTPQNGHRFLLGYDFPCSKTPAFSYRNAVTVSEFDINNLIHEVRSKDGKSTDPNPDRENSLVFKYDYDGKVDLLNLDVDSVLTADYGIQAPISKINGTWHSKMKIDPKNMFFDAALETGKGGSLGPHTLTMKKDDSKLMPLKQVLDDIVFKTACFIRDNEKLFGSDFEKKKLKAKFSAVKKNGNKDELDDFYDRTFGTMTPIYDRDKDLYLPLLTFHFPSKENDDIPKLAIRTKFSTFDRRGKEYLIHPSVCLKNKMEYRPVLHFQRAYFAKQTGRLSFKIYINEVFVMKLTAFGGSADTPAQIKTSAFEAFMAANADEEGEVKEEGREEMAMPIKPVRERKRETTPPPSSDSDSKPEVKPRPKSAAKKPAPKKTAKKQTSDDSESGNSSSE